MADNGLTYDELKLGEKAREAFFEGKSLEWIKDNCPVYLNTRPVFGNLHVTDFEIARVFAGLGGLIVGDTGTGKTQAVSDIYRYYFGGDKSTGGHGVWIDGKPEMDIYSEVFTQLNKGEARFDLTDNIEAMIFSLNEMNRCPEVAQNQFLPLGEGAIRHRGRTYSTGREGV